MSLTRMLYLAGEANFDFVVIKKRPAKLSWKEKRMLESYTLALAEEGENGLVVINKIDRSRINELQESGFDGKVALVSTYSEIKKLKELRKKLESEWFGEEYIRRNQEYLDA
ncbi:MAG: hypothetical protein QXW70_01345 [Candidatus Anstonellales archaeon]